VRKAGPWSLFEAINTVVKLAYMIGTSGIDESRRLFYVDRLSKKTLKKCIIHIQLSNRPALEDGQTAHGTNSGWFDD